MTGDRFVYVTFIRTTPEKLWQALIDPKFTRQYWCETWQECEWKVGASWQMLKPDGQVINSGKVIEIDPPRKLAVSWRKELDAAIHEEGYSRATYELEPVGTSVKLTIVHEIDRPDSKLIKGVSTGWPRVLASLKSFLETGEALEEMRYLPKAV